MILAAEEFIRRFLLHVLPKGFVRIRHYGWMANRRRRRRATLCLLGSAEHVFPIPLTDGPWALSHRCRTASAPR
jgi:hypothetical protein